MAQGICDSIGSALFGVAWARSEYVSSLVGLSVSFSKSTEQSIGMLQTEEGSLNINENIFL